MFSRAFQSPCRLGAWRTHVNSGDAHRSLTIDSLARAVGMVDEVGAHAHDIVRQAHDGTGQAETAKSAFLTTASMTGGSGVVHLRGGVLPRCHSTGSTDRGFGVGSRRDLRKARSDNVVEESENIVLALVHRLLANSKGFCQACFRLTLPEDFFDQ